jgi:hypothetical protein
MLLFFGRPGIHGAEISIEKQSKRDFFPLNSLFWNILPITALESIFWSTASM